MRLPEHTRETQNPQCHNLTSSEIQSILHCNSVLVILTDDARFDRQSSDGIRTLGRSHDIPNTRNLYKMRKMCISQLPPPLPPSLCVCYMYLNIPGCSASILTELSLLERLLSIVATCEALITSTPSSSQLPLSLSPRPSPCKNRVSLLNRRY